MTALVVGGTNVREDANGRYNLNDLHRAAGGNRRFGPGRWTRTDTFQALVTELKPEMAFAPAHSVRGGAAPGTFVCEELVIAYAMWISPAFHIRVIRAYREQSGQQSRQVEDLHHRRISYEKRSAAGQEKASIGASWMGKWRHLKPALVAEKKLLDAAIQPGLFPAEQRA